MRLAHVLALSVATLATVAVVPSCSSSDNADTPADPTGLDGSVSSGCSNVLQDPGELGIDCGGPCKACDGAKCAADADCKSEKCSGAVCGPSKDKTCGVGLPNPCELSAPCGQDKDCKSDLCTLAKCAAVSPAAHTDGRRDAGETDVDCGGVTGAPVCKEGRVCAADTDCESTCTAAKQCAAPTRSDGKISPSLGESDIDCGGTLPDKNGLAAVACRSGKKCAAGIDCESKFCGADSKCEPRKAGRKDGDETDIDCGGTADPDTKVVPARCADDLSCTLDGDCRSTFCNTSLQRCVAGRSCKGAVGNATAGIVTCGKRETGDATKVHESCCRTLPLPATTTVKLDKYEVTAGRMRQFIESAGPNLRKWVNDEINAGTPTGVRLAADIPAIMRDLLPASKTPGEPLNMVMQVGATVMDIREPSMVQGCFQDGTSDTAGAYGANTYYWDHATLKAHFGPTIAARRFTQAQYDEKSMNCGAYWMYAAFCAWDGGRMPIPAEIDEVWGAEDYPWGATFGYPVSPGGGMYQYELTANYFNNRASAAGPGPGLFYHFPDYGNAYDEAGYIAAPGRFILDKTTSMSANGEHWMDLGANLMELTQYTSEFTRDFCDFSITNAPGDNLLPTCTGGPGNAQTGVVRKAAMPVAHWTGGSWEGHRSFTVTGPESPYSTMRHCRAADAWSPTSHSEPSSGGMFSAGLP